MASYSCCGLTQRVGILHGKHLRKVALVSGVCPPVQHMLRGDV